MSLLDELNVCNLLDLDKRSNTDLDDIDKLILDIGRYECEYELFKNNYLFILNYIYTNHCNDKQLVVYNKYGFNNGSNLYTLYCYILDFYLRFIINYSYF
jgi:hypothetical protein